MKENRQETYSASCCSGKVYLGPSRKPHLPQGQDSPSTGPKGGPGPCYSQTSVPGAEVLATGRMNALRQGRKRKLPQLWGLLTWRKVGDRNIAFMVDTGAELSVVTKPVAPLSKKTTAVTGVLGKEMIKSFCQPRKCQMGGTPSDS